MTDAPAFLTPVAADFEQRYLAAREKEGWRYDDDAVARLPQTAPGDPHAALWQLRADTAARFVAHLRERGARRVMELGCGNGWFSHTIARGTGAAVLGVDINETELRQASRVFAAPGLRFAYADVFEAEFEERFDAVVLNGAVQYFADPPALWRRLEGWLAVGGELHVLDSPVYGDAAAAAAARARSADYFAELGVPEMAARYHHHTHAAFPGFSQRDSAATRWLGRLTRQRRSPFPWLLRPRVG